MKEIVQDGAKVLRDVAKPLPDELFGSQKLLNLITEMSEALDKEPEGVALAAPQIGIPYRLFIVRKDRTMPQPENIHEEAPQSEMKPEIDVYINPEITKTSRKKAKEEEGCLSIRGVYGITNRHERVTISAQNTDGSKFKRGAGGLLAQIFEHEMDHLNGVLFTDHAVSLFTQSHEQST